MEIEPGSTGFAPPIYLRHPLVQTFLGSLRIKRRFHKPLLAGATPFILTTGQNTRLKGCLLRAYFIAKWRRSLSIKQQLYPEIYNFRDIFKLKTVRAMTGALLERYSDYPDAQAYFADYTLCAEALLPVAINTTIITARDDPIIAVDDFKQLVLPSAVQGVILSHGGYNGFLTALAGPRFHEPFMKRLFETCVTTERSLA